MSVNADDIALARELAAAARAAGDHERERRAYVSMLATLLRVGPEADVPTTWDEVLGAGLADHVAPLLRVQIAAAFERLGDTARAEREYAAIHGGAPRDVARVKAALAHATLALRRGALAEAEALAALVAGVPALHADARAMLSSLQVEIAARRAAG